MSSSCCCIGVRCKCPKGKVCPTRKLDINEIQKYVTANKLSDEERSKYISSLMKSIKKKKSARKSKKSARKSKKRNYVIKNKMIYIKNKMIYIY
jgi:hypothetical protein